MPFLNETQHPLAHSLHAHLLHSMGRFGLEDPEFYKPLEVFRNAQAWGEEKSADLYALIEDSFDGDWIMMGEEDRTTILSRCLWKNARRFAQ